MGKGALQKVPPARPPQQQPNPHACCSDTGFGAYRCINGRTLEDSDSGIGCWLLLLFSYVVANSTNAAVFLHNTCLQRMLHAQVKAQGSEFAYHRHRGCGSERPALQTSALSAPPDQPTQLNTHLGPHAGGMPCRIYCLGG